MTNEQFNEKDKIADELISSDTAELPTPTLGKHFNPVLQWARPIVWRENFEIANPQTNDNQLKLPIE